jgi:DNA-binding response OmpR family regulator
MTSINHILIVDDDPDLRSLLTRYLEGQGIPTTAVADGKAMDAFLDRGGPVDLLILDLMLPGEDGLSIARRLKMERALPIIILSARGEEIDRIVGLEMGADDYLPKPFNPRELLARIKAVLRRPLAASTRYVNTTHLVEFGPFKLDLESHVFTRDGEEITLTSGEYDLLNVFLELPRRVLGRDLLLDRLKGYDRDPFDRSIDVRVTRLRKKIEDNPAEPAYIRTIWGEGYLFDPTGGKGA